MVSQPACPVCDFKIDTRLTPAGTIYENDYWIAELFTTLGTTAPFAVDAIIVRTKAHREAFEELISEELKSLGSFLRDVANSMIKVLGAERVNISMWADKAQYHVPFVLQPRYSGEVELSRVQGLELQEQALEKVEMPNIAELEQAAEGLRAYLR